MGDVPESSIIPMMIVGPIAIAIGIIVIVKRVKFLSYTQDQQRLILGKDWGDAFARRQSPFWVAFAGAGWIAIGGTMLCGAIFGLVSSSSGSG